jgi:hypothetical protein
VGSIDWHEFDIEPLARELRDTLSGPEAERMIWAFERALAVARVDDELVEFLLAASICLAASRSGKSPRDVLEAFFRRSVPDEVWRDRYLPLFAPA